MCSKKTLLYVCLVGMGLFFLAAFSGSIGLCPSYSYSSCSALFNGIAEALLPIFSLFLFSIITYKMRDEVYRAWRRFATVWIPLSIVLIFIAPEYANEFFYQIASKGGAAFITSVLFVIISLIIIIWKYLSPNSKYKNDFKEGSRT